MVELSGDVEKVREAIDSPPILDAEKIGADRLADRFRPPPGIGSGLSRSTLLVGNRGAGKTMLLLDLKQTYPGVTMYGDLRAILNCISNDTGAAGLTLDAIPLSKESAIRSKTVSVLAFWVASQCMENAITVNPDYLSQALPVSLREAYKLDGNPRRFAWNVLARSDLGLYADGPDSLALVDLITNTFVLDGTEEIPLLLLDRAEKIPYPCLDPVLMLLDQTLPVLTIIATRPGIIGIDQGLSPDTPTAGDHYQVRHLGNNPYSEEWEKFMIAALRSWVPFSWDQLPQAQRSLLLHLSRDSLRCALELVHSSIDEKGRYIRERMCKAIEELRRSLLWGMQGVLRNLNSNIGVLIKTIRKSYGREFTLPVCVELPDEPEPKLFNVGRPMSEMTREEQFVQLALRTGFLSTIDGVAWHPYALLQSLEIFPLLAWKDGDPWLNTSTTS